MIIAFPIDRPNGKHSEVSAHFGHAPYFAAVDLVTGEARFMVAESIREEGECAPIRALVALGVKEVHCRQLGRGALQRCFEAGMRVYQCQGRTIAEALLDRALGEAPDLPDGALCEGHTGGCAEP